MKEKSSWRFGCGIGCGVVLVLVLLAFASGYFLIRDTVDAFQEVEASTKQLEEEVGKMDDFVPDPSGEIPAERIETFLHVRKELDQAGKQFELAFEESVEKLQQAEKNESFWEAWGVMKKGLGFFPQLARYYVERNRVLLQARMNLGEYYYYYVIVYFSWLSKSPGDGPDFLSMAQKNPGQIQTFHFRQLAENQGDQTEQDRSSRTRRRMREDQRHNAARMINDVILPMLKRQKDAFTEAPDSEEQIAWSKALTQEIEALDKHPDRIPWQDAVPSAIQASVEPFREALLQSYNEKLNLMEIIPFGEFNMQVGKM